VTEINTLVEAVSRYGQAMVLRRRIGTTNAFTDVSVKGVPRAYQPNELLGGLQQGDQRVVISSKEIRAAGWPAPPQAGDLVVWNSSTRTVRGARHIKIGEEILGYDLWVRG